MEAAVWSGSLKKKIGPSEVMRGIGRVERDRPVAEVVQPQVGDDLRLQHRDDVGGPRDPGSRPDLLGHARAAEDARRSRTTTRSPARAR